MAESKIPMTNSSGNGYCKMGDGTLIMWGADSVYSTKGVFSRKAITFPIEMTTDFPDMFIAGLTEDATLVCVPSSRSKTGALAAIYNNSSTRTIYFSWFAIGRWK